MKETERLMKAEFDRVLLLDAKLEEANVTLEFSNRMTNSAGKAKCRFEVVDNKVICVYGLKVILSTRWLELHSTEESFDTLRHELAHILNYIVFLNKQDHHGRNWKRYAVLLGARPERCFSTENVSYDNVKKLKWSTVCRNHGEVEQYARKLKDACNPNNPRHRDYYIKYGILGRTCPKCSMALSLRQNH